MDVVDIINKVEDSKFEYAAMKNGKKIGSIKGTIQNPKILWLWVYEAMEEETLFMEKLQERFYSDCLETIVR